MNSAIELVISGKEKKLYLDNIVDSLNKLKENKAIEKIRSILLVFQADSKYTNLYKDITIDKNLGFPVNNYIKSVIKERNKKIITEVNAKEKIKQFLKDPNINLDDLKKEIGLDIYKKEIRTIGIPKNLSSCSNISGDLEVFLYKNQPINYKISYNPDYQRKIEKILDNYKENNLKLFPKYLTTILDLFYEDNSVKLKSIIKKEYIFMNHNVRSNGNLPQEYLAQLLVLLKNNKDSYILKEKTSALELDEISDYERRFLFFKVERKSLKKRVQEKNLYVCNHKIYNDVFDILKNSDSEVIC